MTEAVKSKQKHRKLKIFLSVLLIIVLAFGFSLLGIFMHENTIWKGGETEYKGTVAEYDFSASDSFDRSMYPVIRTDDGNIKILQLTDTHFRNSGTFASKVGMNYITDGLMKGQVKKLVKQNEPDLIVITGDLITFINAHYAYSQLVEFFDSLNTPWTVTFGNHDAEYNCDKAALAEILMTGENSLFQPGPTNITGLGHHAVLVEDQGGNLTQAVILMDSNDYVLTDLKDKYPDRRFSTEQAGIYADQIEWYEWLVKGLQAEAGGQIRTSVFFHINFSEELNKDGFRDKVLELGSSKYFFFGHTHATGNTVKADDGLFLTNGVKAGYNYVSVKEKGGTLIFMNAQDDVKIQHLNRGLFKTTVIEEFICK